MNEEYEGGSSIVPLNDVDGFLGKLERSREAPKPAPVEYRQTTGPDLDQFLKGLEQGQQISDSPAQVTPRRPNSGRIVARTKFRLVGEGPRVQPNAHYGDVQHDALSVGPAPRPVQRPNKKLKGLI